MTDQHECKTPDNFFSGTRVVALHDWQCPECGARWRHHWDTDNEGNPTMPPDEWWTRIPELPHG